MNKLLFITIILGVSIFVSSCKKKENPGLSITIDNLQGKWKHSYNVPRDLRMPPEFEQIFITNDSFYIRWKSRVELLTLECPVPIRIHYSKGKLELINDKLYFNGIYATSNYEVNTDSTGCNIVGPWVDSFQVASIAENNIHIKWLIPIKNLSYEEENIQLMRITE